MKIVKDKESDAVVFVNDRGYAVKVITDRGVEAHVRVSPKHEDNPAATDFQSTIWPTYYQFHCITGPAVSRPGGKKEWYVAGEKLNEFQIWYLKNVDKLNKVE